MFERAVYTFRNEPILQQIDLSLGKSSSLPALFHLLTGDKTWQATEDYMNEFMADPRR